jgi:hypothetical protein
VGLLPFGGDDPIESPVPSAYEVGYSIEGAEDERSGPATVRISLKSWPTTIAVLQMHEAGNS